MTWANVSISAMNFEAFCLRRDPKRYRIFGPNLEHSIQMQPTQAITSWEGKGSRNWVSCDYIGRAKRLKFSA
jgi:hypothetical protein